MSRNLEEKLQISAQEYQQMVRQKNPKPPLAKNLVMAFLSGGVVCLLGQVVLNFFIGLGFTSQEAANPTVAVFIFLGALATGLGFFDRMAHYTGAGTAIPVTGFANSITAAAMEFKKEGLVAGVGSKMFVLAGSVIVFGVVTAMVIGLISALV